MGSTRSRLVAVGSRVAVACALGVATTVAVAWGLGAWGDWRGGEAVTSYLHPASADESNIRVWQVSRAGAVRRVVVTFGEPEWNEGLSYIPEEAWYDLRIGPDARFDVSWGRLREAVDMPGNRVSSVEDARGWPLLALRCWFVPRRPEPAKVRGGIPLDADVNAESPMRILPYLPMWGGLVANSAIYASAWLVLLVLPGSIRALLRRRRGLCPRCGYDLGGTPGAVCPECGWDKPVPA